MSINNLKKEIHKLIDETNDEEILNVLKEDIVAYTTSPKQFDDLSDLSPDDRAELEEQMKEDPLKDTISYDEFQKNIAQWRIALLQKRDLKTK